VNTIMPEKTPQEALIDWQKDLDNDDRREPDPVPVRPVSDHWVGKISGRITLDGKTAAEGATVEVMQGANTIRKVQTGTGGYFGVAELPPAAYIVIVTSPQVKAPVPFNVTVQAGQEARLDKQLSGTIMGTVTLDGTKAAPMATQVFVYNETQPVMPGYEVSKSLLEADGSYSTSALDDGLYTVKVMSPDGTQEFTAQRHVQVTAPNPTTQDFRLHATINVNPIKLASGASPEGATVDIYLKGTNKGIRSETADKDGNIQAFTLPEGSYTVTVKDPAGKETKLPKDLNVKWRGAHTIDPGTLP
jgi:hypothetical protein